MDAKLHGPFFALGADVLVEAEIDRMRHEVAGATQRRVLDLLGQSLRNPTGYYESRISVDRSTSDRDIVTDNNVVYGPWLEGTSSRNSTTRFKGYHNWRLAAQSANQQAHSAAEAGADRIVRALS